MKTLKFLTSGLMLLTFCLYSTSGFAQVKKSASTVEVKVKVDFNCADGKALIEKGLKKEPGIAQVFADAKTGIVSVYFDGYKTNREKIFLAIEKIGYTTEHTPSGRKIIKACNHSVDVVKPDSEK